jgi:predicted Zn-dependent protease with MMP-like domain
VIISDDDFEAIIAEAIDLLPEEVSKRMNNVAVVWENEPNIYQRKKLLLRSNQTLFGLYEGIPLTARNNNYSMVLPDKITIFKNPICSNTDNLEELKIEVGKTLWHEVAHHFGLDHNRIDKLELKNKNNKNQY